MLHARRPGIPPRRLDGGGPNVRGDNAPGGLAVGLFLQFLPLPLERGAIEPQNVHEPEILPQDPGSSFQGDEGSLDGQGAASAHGVDQGCPAVPPRGEDDGGRQRLLHGGLQGDLPVSPARQGLAGGVDPELAAIAHPVQVDDGPVAPRARVGPSALPVADAVHDGILGLHIGKPGVPDGVCVGAGRDREVPVGGDDRLPGQLHEAAVKILCLDGRKGIEEIQDALGRAQGEIKANGVRESAFRLDGRLQHGEVGESESPDLPFEDPDGPARTGDENSSFFFPESHAVPSVPKLGQ